MRLSLKASASILALLLAACGGSSAPAASTAPTSAGGAAKPAAAGGQSAASHDDIVAKAKQEGALQAMSTADPASLKAFKDGFTKKYPFIKFELQELTGTEATQRFQLELKSGQAKDWDVLNISEEVFTDTLPYLENVDLIAMSEKGILAIPPKMVYPEGRNVMAPGTQIGVVAYNNKSVTGDKIPKVWEDLLKPEWKGRKMITEVRPNTIAGLVPAKGEEWVKDWATKMKDQQPVWARGNTSVLTAMAAGEYALHSGTYVNSVQRLIEKGSSTLAFTPLDPISVRLALAAGIQKGAKHPNAGLLLLEYFASSEAQKILDEVEPYKSSIYSAGETRSTKLVAGKQVSVASWDYFPKMADYEKMILQAYGLPRAELQDK
jgi:iron(III) transport system substrate-binding protein